MQFFIRFLLFNISSNEKIIFLYFSLLNIKVVSVSLWDCSYPQMWQFNFLFDDDSGNFIFNIRTINHLSHSSRLASLYSLSSASNFKWSKLITRSSTLLDSSSFAISNFLEYLKDLTNNFVAFNNLIVSEVCLIFTVQLKIS